MVVTLNNGTDFPFNATLDTADGTWSAPISIAGLADGGYAVTVTATDAAGNTGAQNPPDLFTVDTAAPTVGFDSGQLPAKVNSDQVLTGTYSDANISGIVVTLDNGGGMPVHIPAVLDTNDLTWSAAIPSAPLTDGTYAVSASATDLAGNTTVEPAGEGRF